MKNSCPNFNSPEWKALENNPLIGKFEAMRDWLENDGVIRTPEEVIKKISDRNMGFNKPGERVVQEIKPGVKPSVQELFDSSPELANNLENKLKDFLTSINVDTIVVNNLQKRLQEKGLNSNAVAVSDILHKAVFLDSNKYNTLDYAEEVATFAIEFMGASKHAEASPLIRRALENIASWEKYQQYYDLYKNDPIYKNNERKLKVEILSKLLAERIVENKDRTKKTKQDKKLTTLETIINGILALFNKIWKSDYYKAVDRFLKQRGIETKGVNKVNIRPFDAVINEIVDDILFNNTSKIVNNSSRARKGETVVSLKEVLENNSTINKIYHKLNSLGFMFTGSPALSNEGTVYRESNDNLHDLDWQVPKELQDNWLDLVKSTFPDLTYKINPKTNQAQVFSKGEKTTHTLIIKGMPVDFFININPPSNKNTFGDMRWQDTFEAKMDIGRNKDIRDLIDFKTSFNDYFSNPNYLYYSLGQIKPGVEELFDSNPELANAVYEALGFNTVVKSKAIITNDERIPEYDDKDFKNAQVALKPEIYDFEADKINELLDLFIPKINKAISLGAVKFTLIRPFYTETHSIEDIGDKALENRDKLRDELLNDLKTFLKSKGFTTNDEGYDFTKEITPQQKQQAQQLYSQYLDTIFSDSKVKDIVYHEGKADFEKFDLNFAIETPGIYFSYYKSSGIFGDKIKRLLLNLKNPYIEDDSLQYDSLEQKYKDKFIQNGYDSIITPGDIGLIFEPEQIHILGSKQDIEGFREFVTQSFTNVKPGVEEQINFEDLLSSKLIDFLNSLNFTTEFKNELLHEFNPLAVTDLLYKTIRIKNNFKDEGLLKETAYVAYSFLGKKNKIRTDLVYSIENINNYQQIFEDYKKRSPQLNDYTIKELIVIDFIADAIKNNFENPRDSYQNRKADYWRIDGNSKLEKQIKYYLSKVKQFLEKLFLNTKLTNDELQNLLSDIANDVLNNTFDKFGTILDTEQQITNYNNTIEKDEKAKEIISKFQKLGLLLTGSLSLRKQGTLYREITEDLHDLDFTVTLDKQGDYFNKLYKDIKSQFEGASETGKIFLMEKFQKELAKNYKKHPLLNSIKKEYPSFKITNSFKGLKRNDVTITGSIDGYLIDLFFVSDLELDKNEKGFQDWEPIFESKIKMGRAKDIRDFANYIPFNRKSDGSFANIKGFRHFTFSNKNKFIDNEVDSDTITSEDVYDQLREEFIRENSIQEIEPNASEEDRSLSIVFQIAEKLSNKLRVPFQIITSDKAFELTTGTKNPWKGQKAFFLGGKVYFVGNNIDFETQFHEFAHPFVRALMVENPRLMNDLYEKFIATPEGQVILQQTLDEYSGVQDNSGIVKEEVLVKAIQLSASKKAQGIKPDNILPTLIQRFFTGLRTFLNKLFGNKPVSRINENSTLYDLAEILLDDEQFELDSTKITQGDIVAYQNNNAELIKSIMDVTNDNAAPVFEIVKDMYDKARGTIRAMNPLKDKELIEALKDEYQRGDLYDLTQNLNKLKLELEKDLELTKDRANRFVVTLNRVENMVSKLREHIKVINSDLSDLTKKQNLDYIKKLKYYENIINYWSNFTKNTMNVFNNDLKLKTDDPIYSFVNNIDENLENARKEVQGDNETGYLKGVGQVLWEQWEDMAERNDKYYTEIIRTLQLNGAPQSQIEAYHKEYYGLTISEKETYDRLSSARSLNIKDKAQLERLKRKMYTEGVILTKEKILETLKGNLGDSNYFNGWLEGYMYQSDPVIGGFAKFLKDALIEVNVKSFDTYYNQTEVLKPLLDALGYTQRQQGKLGREIGFKDKRGFEEDGEIKPKEVWAFIDKFKDVDYTISQKKLEIRQLKEEYDRTRDSEIEKELNQKKTEYLEYLRKWFHQPYTDVFYAKDDIFKNSAEGAAARELRDNWFNDLNAQTDPDLALDDEALVAENLRALRIRYKEMYSYYDRNGNFKNEFDRKITDILIEHRKLTRNFYEERERIGVFENEFNAFKDRLITVELLDPVTQAEEIRRREDEWLKENTYQRLKVDADGKVIYYNVLREKIQQLNAIKDRMPQGDKQREAMEKISKLLEQQISMVNISKDDNNTPDGTIMSEEQIDTLADIQEQINSLRQDILNVNGFTKKESAQLRGLYRSLDRGIPGIQQLISSLYATAKARKRKAGINDKDLERYNLLVQEISDMSSKEPTEYYLDILNDKIKNIEGLPDDFMLKNFGQDVNEITISNVDRLYENILGLDNEVLKELFKASPEFKAWFEKNHYQEVYYDKDRDNEIEVWKRLNIWTVKTPVGDEYYKKREVTYSNGDVVSINRIPNYKYIRKVVKKEYTDENGNVVKLRTEKIVGKTVTNTKEWLPKELPDSPFRNERYYELKNASPDSRDGKLFKLLEKVKEFHLKNQEGKPVRSRLYYDFPRFESSLYEKIITSKEDRQRGISKTLGKKFPIFEYIIRRIRQFYQKAKDDGLETLNPDLDYDLVRVTSEGIEPDTIPVQGLYNIPIDDVSTDFITSMYAYASSLIKQEKLIEIHPIAKALDQVLKTNTPKELEKLDKKNFLNNAIEFVKGDSNVRSNIYETLMKREFYDERLLGFGKNSKPIQTFSKFIFGRASMAMFALNIPAALKDYLGSKYQKMLLMSGGKYIDPKSIAKGEAWAFKVMSEKSFGSASEGMGPQIYQIGAKTLNVQLTELFQVSMKDPRASFARAASRSLPSDVLGMSWLYNFREWLQGQSETSLFGAMMYKQTVYQYDKPIAYMDAWEIRDGVLTIKEGIDPDYGPRKTTHLFVTGDTMDSISTRYNIPIDELKKRLGLENFNDVEPGTELTIATGAKFKDMLNKFNIVQQSLEGNYANMNQPLAQGFLFFRFISYLKKFFTTMFVERFAFAGDPLSGNIRPRYNPGLNELKMGFYISTLRNLYRLSKNTSEQWGIMNQEERFNMLRMPLEIMGLIFIQSLLLPLFGWDEDDDEKYEKLREKSGDLPLPFIADDPEHPFRLMGWAENHALLLAMNVRSENETFIPLPGFGLDDYTKLLDFQSLAFGPTIESYSKMGALGYHTLMNNERAYYKRDSGPYEWQQEGGSKFITTLAKSIGIDGSNVSPIEKIKQKISIKNRSAGG